MFTRDIECADLGGAYFYALARPALPSTSTAALIALLADRAPGLVRSLREAVPN